MAEYKFPSDNAARDDNDGGGDDDNRTDAQRAIDDIHHGAVALVDIASRHTRRVAAQLLNSTADVFDDLAAAFRDTANRDDDGAEAAADDGVNDG